MGLYLRVAVALAFLFIVGWVAVLVIARLTRARAEPGETRDAEDAVAPLLEDAPPVLRLLRAPVAAPDGAIPVSRLGGAPALPDPLGWPRRDGVPLHFLAQLRCAELNGAGGLPGAGMLFFFADLQDFRAGRGAAAPVPAAVLHDPGAEGADPPRAAPEDLPEIGRDPSGEAPGRALQRALPCWPLLCVPGRDTDALEAALEEAGDPAARRALRHAMLTSARDAGGRSLETLLRAPPGAGANPLFPVEPPPGARTGFHPHALGPAAPWIALGAQMVLTALEGACIDGLRAALRRVERARTAAQDPASEASEETLQAEVAAAETEARARDAALRPALQRCRALKPEVAALVAAKGATAALPEPLADRVVELTREAVAAGQVLAIRRGLRRVVAAAVCDPALAAALPPGLFAAFGAELTASGRAGLAHAAGEEAAEGETCLLRLGADPLLDEALPEGAALRILLSAEDLKAGRFGAARGEVSWPERDLG